MLDDRLTSAGAALRELATVAPDGSALGRRRRSRRHLAGAGLVVLALGAGVLAIAGREPAPVRVVKADEGAVPVPTSPSQLLPERLPPGWSLRSWEEGEGITSDLQPGPRLHLFGRGRGAGFAAQPYVAVIDSRNFYPDAQTPTIRVGRHPGLFAQEANGLRRLTFWIEQDDAGPGFEPHRAVTLQGWQLTDAELLRVAEGIEVRPDRLVVGYLPSGFTPLAVDVPALESQPLIRSFEYRRGPATVRLTTVPGPTERLETLLWMRPGTTAVDHDGRTVARTSVPDGIEWRWLQGGGSVLLRGTGASDAVLGQFASSLRSRPAAALPHYVGDVQGVSTSNSTGAIVPVTFRVPFLDDRRDGQRFRSWGYLGRLPDGTVSVCTRFGCAPPPALGEHALATWFPSYQVTVLAVGDGVANVVVGYRDGTTEVLTPVRVVEGRPRMVGVLRGTYEPDQGDDVESVEARAADGTVLERADHQILERADGAP